MKDELAKARSDERSAVLLVRREPEMKICLQEECIGGGVWMVKFACTLSFHPQLPLVLTAHSMPHPSSVYPSHLHQSVSPAPSTPPPSFPSPSVQSTFLYPSNLRSISLYRSHLHQSFSPVPPTPPPSFPSPSSRPSSTRATFAQSPSIRSRSTLPNVTLVRRKI